MVINGTITSTLIDYSKTCFLAILFIFSTSHSLAAAELIMVEEENCIYCKKFNREIATAYPKTSEGTLAPLRRVDLYQPWPDDLAAIEEASVTPTFILVENGQEVDRLIGYPGDEYFWFLLGQMLEKLNASNSLSVPAVR